MGTYRAVSERARAIFGDDAFDADLSETEEADEILGGNLEIVPTPYRVLAPFDDHAGGEVVDLALSQARAKTLVNFAEPVEQQAEQPDEAEEKPAPKKRAAKK